MSKLICLVVAASIGCKAKVASVSVELVAPTSTTLTRSGLDEAAELARSLLDGGTSQVEIIRTIEQAFGAPTLVEPPGTFERAAFWVVVDRSRCAQLRIDMADPYVERDDIDLEPELETEYFACVDTAHGSNDGARFIEAHTALDPERQTLSVREAIDAVAPLLGRPNVLAWDGHSTRLIWARANARRCHFLVSDTLGPVRRGHGITAPDLPGATAPGLPWWGECLAWSLGIPASPFAEERDVLTPERYAALTAPSRPTRVAAARVFFEHAAYESVNWYPQEREGMTALLGAPQLVIDERAAWAVADDTECWALSFDLDVVGGRRDDDPEAWAYCTAIARADASTATLIWAAHSDDLPSEPTAASAWLAAYVGAPGRVGDRSRASDAIWTRQIDSSCIRVTLATNRLGARTSTEVLGPADNGYRACIAGASKG